MQKRTRTEKPLSKQEQRVLAAMQAGVPLMAGQQVSKWVNSNVLSALLKHQLIVVDPITRVYHLTEQGAGAFK